MKAGLDRSERDREGRRDVGQRQPDEVVQDDDRPALLVELGEDDVDELPIGVSNRAVRQGRLMKRRELDLDHPAAPLASQVETGIDGEAIEPGIEPSGISKLPEIAPGSDQPVLDRVACELRVPEDEESSLVQPHDGGASELGEGVMIASPCPLHEPSLVHGRLAFRTRPRRSCLIAYGDEIRFSVLPANGPAPRPPPTGGEGASLRGAMSGWPREVEGVRS